MQSVRTRSMASLPSAEEASSNEAKNRTWNKEVEERKLFATLRDLKGEEKKKFFRSMLANKTANIFHFNLMISSSRFIRESREHWETLNKMELTPDVVTYTSMIRSEVKAGNMSAAEKFFTAMRAKGVEPNEMTHGILIDGYHRHGRLDDVFSAWRRMKEQGLKTNSVIYSSLIDACAKRMDMARAEKLVEEVAANGFLFVPVIFTTLVDLYGRSGDVEKVKELWNSFLEEGHKPDHVMVNAILSVTDKISSLEDVAALYKQIQENRWVRSVLCLLSSRIQTGNSLQLTSLC